MQLNCKFSFGITFIIIISSSYRNRLQQEHDLKVVWVTDIPDDSDNGLQDAFVVITPEHSYILQADSRRKKVK